MCKLASLDASIRDSLHPSLVGTAAFATLYAALTIFPGRAPSRSGSSFCWSHLILRDAVLNRGADQIEEFVTVARCSVCRTGIHF